MFIIRNRLPIHDLDNLCTYGLDLLHSANMSYDEYDTLAEAKRSGSRPCKECTKVRIAKNRQVSRPESR